MLNNVYSITIWPDIKGIETKYPGVIIKHGDYYLTRYKGDWNYLLSALANAWAITIWPDIKGIETIHQLLNFWFVTITIWPDIKGIETDILWWVLIQMKVITIWPDIKGIETYHQLLQLQTLTITIWPDIKGIETILTSLKTMYMNYYLTRYKGDWNTHLHNRFSFLCIITIWPDIKGIETH